MRLTLLSLWLLLYSLVINAQVTPAENDTINYRLAGFSVPENNGADSYLLEVARGLFSSEHEFKTNILIKERGSTNGFIKLLPAFGESYTWRISYLKKNKLLDKTGLHHFRTGYLAFADTSRYRLRIIGNRVEDTSVLLFLDNLRALCDLKGNVLWYLPNIPNIVDSNTVVRDLRATPQGTISFLTAKSGYEISYDGKLLWSAPDDGRVSGDTSEYYHHEFERLRNGNYLIAGNEYIEREVPGNIDITRDLKRTDALSKNGIHYARIQCGTIIEYDTAKNIVWVWRAGDHFGKEEFFTRKDQRGIFNSSTHLNSFYFDEDKHVVYASFRDLSRIIKISYPGGNIIASFDGTPGPGKETNETVFLSQHNITKDVNGNILLFNNNIKNKDRSYTTSHIMELREPSTALEGLGTIWQFPCDIDTLTQAISPSGGSVAKFDDGSFLASMGSTNRIFIVDRHKKVLWNALCERKDLYTSGQPWVSQNGYKVSAIKQEILHEMLSKNHR